MPDAAIEALCELTTELERIFAKHPSCEDSDVRDRICAVLQRALLEGDLQTKPPVFYGILSPSANLALRKALHGSLASKDVRDFVQNTGPDERVQLLKDALAEDRIVSRSGLPMTEVLGEWV